METQQLRYLALACYRLLNDPLDVNGISVDGISLLLDGPPSSNDGAFGQSFIAKKSRGIFRETSLWALGMKFL